MCELFVRTATSMLQHNFNEEYFFSFVPSWLFYLASFGTESGCSGQSALSPRIA